MIGIEAIKYPTSSLIKLLMNCGIPVGQVKSVHEALNSDQATANRMVTQIDHPLIGSYLTLGIPVQLSQTPGEIYKAPPTLGQHTREILKDYLGLDTSEIDSLYLENVVK
jgi:crotonobetainyl-CoA:carnitine CoA-transferase CaiB-like acyl-CoA transferase